MKKYLWVGVLLCVCTYASNNPFELQENFGQLEHDQEGLLTDFKKITDADDSLDKEIEAKKTKKVEINEKHVPSLDKVKVEKNVSDELLNEIRQKALDASKKEAEVKKQAILPKMLKKEKTKDMIAKKVATYEKKREVKLDEAAALEKLAKEQKEEKERKLAALKQKEEDAKLAKEQKKEKAIQLTEEKKLRKLKTETTVSNTKKQKIQIQNSLPKIKKVEVLDIDVEKEKKEAKVAADKAYEEAVKEMSGED